ncbi:MAG: (2Fe-2S)-binding protein [Rhodospirillaceae bacterium]
MVELSVNDRTVKVDVAPDTPLLWLLRDHLGLTGTKFGCGSGLCGACSVLINGAVARACSVPCSTLDGAKVTTIEGLIAAPDSVVTGVTEAWIAEQVPQCGYCTPGMVVSAVALLRKMPHPAEPAIAEAMTNLCRCGTYDRVRKAISRAAVSS